jgi:hypothetical protein
MSPALCCCIEIEECRIRDSAVPIPDLVAINILTGLLCFTRSLKSSIRTCRLLLLHSAKANLAGKELKCMVGIAHRGVPTGEFMFTTVKVRGINIRIPAWLPKGHFRRLDAQNEFCTQHCAATLTGSTHH